MKQSTIQNLQVIWEQLNGLMYDIENFNDLSDIGCTIEDCIKRLEDIGIHAQED